MRKAWWWVVAVFGIGGLSCIGNEMTNLGVFFILCAIGVGAAIIIVGSIADRKQNEEVQADEQRLWNEGFPIIYSFDLGHFTGAYEYEKWHAGYPDSAGGWDVWGGVKNISPYVINYIRLYVYPVDRIGSKVAKTECWKYTGPFERGKMTLIRSEHNWYDLSVASVEVEKIVVDYNGVGTQVTAGPASFTALHGAQAGTDNWTIGKPNPNGTWDVKSVIKYQSLKASDRVILYVIPLAADGTELAPAAELSSRHSWKKADVMTVWWSGIWKNQPVHSVKIQKYKIEHTDGTSQIVEF